MGFLLPVNGIVVLDHLYREEGIGTPAIDTVLIRVQFRIHHLLALVQNGFHPVIFTGLEESGGRRDEEVPYGHDSEECVEILVVDIIVLAGKGIVGGLEHHLVVENIGVNLAIPVEDILDLKAAVKRKRLEVDAAQIAKDAAFDQLKLQIATLWVKITNNLVALKSASENAAIYQGAGSINQEQFQNGEMSIEDFALTKERENSAVSNYQSLQTQITTDIITLEILTHTPIITNTTTDITLDEAVDKSLKDLEKEHKEFEKRLKEEMKEDKKKLDDIEKAEKKAVKKEADAREKAKKAEQKSQKKSSK